MLNNCVCLFDTCRVCASTLYCHTHFAYLCSTCNVLLHGATMGPHHRVRVCEACECAPSAFTCKADAASLCINCDFEIQAANPIASRHHRVPVSPLSPHHHHTAGNEVVGCESSSADMDAQEVDSWLLLDDQEEDYSYEQQHPFSFSEDISDEPDSVVPINQSVEAQDEQQDPNQQQQNVYFSMMKEREPSNNDPSYFPSVPMPLLEFQRTTASYVSSYRFPRGIQMFPNVQLHCNSTSVIIR